jgi:hypothetical protein
MSGYRKSEHGVKRCQFLYQCDLDMVVKEEHDSTIKVGNKNIGWDKQIKI